MNRRAIVFNLLKQIEQQLRLFVELTSKTTDLHLDELKANQWIVVLSESEERIAGELYAPFFKYYTRFCKEMT